MTLWASSRKRLKDPMVDSRLCTLFELCERKWPFDKWEFQIGSTGAYRTKEMQAEQVKSGASKTMQSKHCDGLAIDITLYWDSTQSAIWNRYAYAVVAGFIMTCARELGLKMTWGADWNNNGNIAEENNWEVDFVHWELAN